MTFHPDLVEAVVFDLGGVFIYPDPHPAAERMAATGVPVPSGDDFDQRFRRAHHAAVHHLSQDGEDAAEHRPEFWRRYDRAYGADLGVPDEQLDDFDVAIRVGWDWPHEPNIAALHRLATTGMPMAIVSNNDGSAPEQCRTHGICQVLEGPLPVVAAIIDSALVGARKPDPTIMAPALYALGIPAERVLYVGDTVQADVLAATRAGMQVVQLDPFDHHAAFDHARMNDVDEIVDALT
ncbi:MAG: HAD family hydrolase [Acidimicrobiales bacterium]